MVYSICERFITKDYPTYSEWRTDCQCDEIVSADCGLFCHEILEEYDEKRELSDHQQWLAVHVVKKEKKSRRWKVLNSAVTTLLTERESPVRDLEPAR